MLLSADCTDCVQYNRHADIDDAVVLYVTWKEAC